MKNPDSTFVCAFHKRKFGRSLSMSIAFLTCQIEGCRNTAEFFGFKTTLEITGVEL